MKLKDKIIIWFLGLNKEEIKRGNRFGEYYKNEKRT